MCANNARKGAPGPASGTFFAPRGLPKPYQPPGEMSANNRNIRVRFLDGFNMYHRIKEYHARGGKDGRAGANYRWVDYRKLLCQFLKDDHRFAGITFFTACRDSWDSGRASRHETFLAALRARGVEVVSGYFAKQSGGYKEKQTDVNIALAMVLDAADDKYDRCWLLSADNDFAPVLAAIRQKFNKEAGLIIPPVTKTHSRVQADALKDAATVLDTGKPLLLRLKFARHFAGCALPETIEGGRETIVMPPQYDTF